MAAREKPMIDLFKRVLPVISVVFDVDEEVFAVNCLSCWGDGDIPQFLGQFPSESQAKRFGDLHSHWGDMGTGLQTNHPMAWMICESCDCYFSVWPAYIEALGAGRTYSRQVLDFERAELVRVHANNVDERPCGVCNWLLDLIDQPISPRDLAVFWRNVDGIGT